MEEQIEQFEQSINLLDLNFISADKKGEFTNRYLFGKFLPKEDDIYASTLLSKMQRNFQDDYSNGNLSVHITKSGSGTQELYYMASRELETRLRSFAKDNQMSFIPVDLEEIKSSVLVTLMMEMAIANQADLAPNSYTYGIYFYIGAQKESANRYQAIKVYFSNAKNDSTQVLINTETRTFYQLEESDDEHLDHSYICLDAEGASFQYSSLPYHSLEKGYKVFTYSRKRAKGKKGKAGSLALYAGNPARKKSITRTEIVQKCLGIFNTIYFGTASLTPEKRELNKPIKINGETRGKYHKRQNTKIKLQAGKFLSDKSVTLRNTIGQDPRVALLEQAIILVEARIYNVSLPEKFDHDIDLHLDLSKLAQAGLPYFCSFDDQTNQLGYKQEIDLHYQAYRKSQPVSLFNASQLPDKITIEGTTQAGEIIPLTASLSQKGLGMGSSLPSMAIKNWL